MQPHPLALARHRQPTQRADSYTIAELQRLAGQPYDYPTPDPAPTGCPICGEPVPLGGTYCGKPCYVTAQKRISAATYGRTELDPLPAYSYPPPRAKR